MQWSCQGEGLGESPKSIYVRDRPICSLHFQDRPSIKDFEASDGPDTYDFALGLMCQKLAGLSYVYGNLTSLNCDPWHRHLFRIVDELTSPYLRHSLPWRLMASDLSGLSGFPVLDAHQGSHATIRFLEGF